MADCPHKSHLESRLDRHHEADREIHTRISGLKDDIRTGFGEVNASLLAMRRDHAEYQIGQATTISALKANQKMLLVGLGTVGTILLTVVVDKFLDIL